MSADLRSPSPRGGRSSTPKQVWLIIGVAVLLALSCFAIGGFIAVKSVLKKESEPAASTTPGPARAPAEQTAVALPSATAAESGEAAATRKEVLNRVDLMKNLSNKEKDDLYAQIERARGFLKVAAVPFGSGKDSPDATNVDELIKRLQETDIRTLLEDPTVVLVYVGYADNKGDPALNLEISRTRAEKVQASVANRLKLGNATHPVGMGGQDFFDKTNREKNRIVEVWAVQP